MDIDTLILGAGPCGLAMALELGRQGQRVALVDRNSEPGGLARSFGSGPYRTDLSIHRLQVQRPKRLAELDALLRDQFVHVSHKTIHLQLGRRRVPYPIRLGSLARLPWIRSAQAGIQVLRRLITGLAPAPKINPGEARGAWDPAPNSSSKINPGEVRGGSKINPGEVQDRSYRAWFEARYGPELFHWIAGPLLEKQWGIPADELSSAFGEHRRFSVSFKDFLTGLPILSRMMAHAVPVDFLYGRHGSGPLMERLAQKIEQQGSRFLLGCEPTRIRHKHARIQAVELSDGSAVECGRLASTIPLPALVRLMDPAPPPPLARLTEELGFRHLVVVALALDRPRVSGDHTTYFPERRFPFSRTFECKNASQQLVPPGSTVLGFELPCFADDPIWTLPDDELVSWMASFGPDLGFDPGELRQGFVIRAPEAYPLYRVGHHQVVSRVLRWLHGELYNLYVVGRNGLLRLDNMDHALTMGLDLAEHLVRDGSPRDWYHGLQRYESLSYID